MPATVVVGLQWGDEGKGKTTDLLAESVAHGRALPGRRQRRAHDRPRRRGLQAAPRAERRAAPAHHARSSATAWSSIPRTLIDEMAMLEVRGVDPWRAPGQRRGARDHAVPRGARRGPGGTARGRRDRHDAPRHRPRLRAIGRGGSAIRMGDLLDPAGLRVQARARVLPEKNAVLLETLRARRRSSLDDLVARRAGWGERLAPHIADTTRWCRTALARRAARAARGRPGDAARPRPRHVPVRHELEPDRGRRVHRRWRGSAARSSEVIGVMKAYSTRVGSGPLPDRAARRDRRAPARSGAASSARRPDGGGAAAGSTPCRCGTPSRSTARRASCSTSSTSCPACRRSGSASATGRRTGASMGWPSSRRSWSAPSRCTRCFDGWDEDLEGPAGMGDLPPAAAALRRCARAAAPASRSRSSAWAPIGPQTIVRRSAAARRSRAGRRPWPGRGHPANAGRGPGEAARRPAARPGHDPRRRLRSARARDRWRLRRDDGSRARHRGARERGHARRRDVRPEIGVGDIAAIVTLAREGGGPGRGRAGGAARRGSRGSLDGRRGRRLRARRGRGGLEGSKALCRRIARTRRRSDGPTAPRFDAVTPALAFAAALGGRVVVKADGLAAGKGVTVCADAEEAESGDCATPSRTGVFGDCRARASWSSRRSTGRRRA